MAQLTLYGNECALCMNSQQIEELMVSLYRMERITLLVEKFDEIWWIKHVRKFNKQILTN